MFIILKVQKHIDILPQEDGRGITRLASIKFTIISSTANFWSKLSKGELTYGGGSSSGVKMQG
jgi:hypothetical protein